MPLDDAQLLETRHFGIEEVSRWFGVPQHMLSELTRATWANVESLKIEFVEYGLMPYLQIWEAEANDKLFSSKTPGMMFVKHVVEGLLRGDSAARAEFYNKALQAGWMSPNEVRLKEDLPPIGPDGDVYLVQSALVPLDQVGQEPEPVPEPEPEPEEEPDQEPEDDEPDEEEENARQRTEAAHAAVLAEACSRMLRKEATAAKRYTKRGVAGFLSWLVEWRDELLTTVIAAYGPGCDVMAAASGMDGLDLAKKLAEDHVNRSVSELSKVARASTDSTLPAMITELVGAWPETRAAAC